MPSGSGGKMVVWAVGSLFTVSSPSFVNSGNWTNFVSESLQHTFGEVEEGAITGYKAAPPSYQGVDNGAGDIQLEPNPNALGHFLHAVFGMNSGSVVTAAGSWGANSGSALNLPVGYGTNAREVSLWEFIPRQTAYDERTYLPPNGLVIYKDTGSAMLFDGTVFNSIEFNVQAGQLAKATVAVMARDVRLSELPSSASALRNPGGKPWVWDMASFQYGPSVNSLVAFDKFEQITIKYEQPIEGVSLLDGTKKYGEMQANGFQRVTINGTMTFRNWDEYITFRNYEERFLRGTFTNVNSNMIIGNPSSAHYYALTLEVPGFKFLTYNNPIQGPNRLTVQFTAKGEFNVASLYAIKATLKNTWTASKPYGAFM
jgi:hypothetical protein